MSEKKRYPKLNVDLDIIRENASVICDLCMKSGITTAGVIKFSDGDIDIAKAYKDGGCSQIASSRIIHLQRIKEALPDAITMLIRIPMISEIGDVVQWADISLNSEETVLRQLDIAAASRNKKHSVILMLDAGDRREGLLDPDDLTRLAVKVEKEMPCLHLAGIGSSFACVSGILPDWNNLSELTRCAEQIEEALGRRLEIISGGSSIDLMLLGKSPIPSRVNHLRIGGAIANPVGIRLNRNVRIAGLDEDAFSLRAEIIEIQDTPSASGGSGINWAGRSVSFDDQGCRKRAIIALGSQDIGDPSQLIPKDPGITIIGGSSDHTVLDITESQRTFSVGDTIGFRLFYMPLLYCFATRHVNIEHHRT